tara:strand:- start:1005 stop:1340 length:336 start_codon:yes stop_codon:yes gene_type:complete
MKFLAVNKINLVAFFQKGILSFSLIFFFIAKPIIVQSIENQDDMIEECEENERDSEENETDIETELFETELPLHWFLGKLYLFTFDLNELYNISYINSFEPEISSPPPKLV